MPCCLDESLSLFKFRALQDQSWVRRARALLYQEPCIKNPDVDGYVIKRLVM